MSPGPSCPRQFLSGAVRAALILLAFVSTPGLESAMAAEAQRRAKPRSVPASAPEPSASNEAGLWARASHCDLAALGEVIEFVRRSEPGAVRMPLEAIRLANGRCMRFVLAAARTDEIRRFCSAPESLTAAQTARELRRRIAAIESDELLRTNAAALACRDSYAHELKTTRVVLRERR